MTESAPQRSYRYWTDEELWDLFCWYEAKRRIGKIATKAYKYGTTPANLGLHIANARKRIHAIEHRLGKTIADREAKIREATHQ